MQTVEWQCKECGDVIVQVTQEEYCHCGNSYVWKYPRLKILFGHASTDINKEFRDAKIIERQDIRGEKV